MKKIVTLGLCMATTACRTSGPAGSTAQDAAAIISSNATSVLSPNDVSILMPVLQSPGFLNAAIKSTDMPDPTSLPFPGGGLPTDGQSFLPTWASVALTTSTLVENGVPPTGNTVPWANNTSPGAGGGQPYDHLTAIALRLDPCANYLETNGDDSKCNQQLRILWQPIQTFGSQSFASDVNIHTVYRLERGEFSRIMSFMRTLKASAGFDYSQAPLGVQPAMLKQGPQGSYYQGVRTLIHNFARASRLNTVAGSRELPPSTVPTDFWDMTVYSVVAGVPSYVSLPTLGGAHEVSLQANSMGDNGGDPMGTGPDAYFNNFFSDGATLSASQAELAKINRANNPLKNDFNTLDCSSCHLATFKENEIMQTHNITARISTDSYTSQWNLKGMIETQHTPSRTVLQMFSYSADDGVTPVIQTRVINESAFVADYVQAHYPQ